MMNRLPITTALLWLALTALLPFSPPALAGEQTLRFSGTARDESGRMLYQEHHRLTGECREGVFHPRQHSVDYRDADGDPLASKQLDYTPGLLQPEVEFLQPDFDESLIIERQDDRLRIRWDSPNDGRKTHTVDTGNGVVVDSGFDHLVRRYWQAVTGGEAIEFRFLAPTRGEHYAFVLEPASDTPIAAHQVVRIRPAGLVLRMLVDPILLGYDKQGLLTDYVGLTNIRQSAEGNYVAHIRYRQTQSPDCPLIW